MNRKMLLNYLKSLCYILCGIMFCQNSISAQDGACVKVEWSENYGGFQHDGANSIIQTQDKGYVAVGYSRSSNMMLTENKGKSDYWIVKVDSLGVLQWQASFGGNENDIASDVVETSDGSIYVVGGAVSFDADVTGSHGAEDVWVLKLSSDGNLIWSKAFGGSQNERAESIIASSDGNFVIAGYSESTDGDVESNRGDFDYWVFKMNANGDLLWENNYGGSLSDWGFDVKEALDGGYYIGGSTISVNGQVTENNGFYDYWLIKTDVNGDMEWQNSYGGTLEERAYELALTSDGGVLLTGTSNSADWDVQGNNGGYDYWLTKIAPSGDLEWARSYGGGIEDRSFTATVLSDDSYLIAGYSLSSDGLISNNYGGFDGWLTKLDSEGNLIWEKNIGGSVEDRIYSIIENENGGYTAAGYSASNDLDLPDNFGARDLWIINLSPDTFAVDLGADTTLCFNDNLVLVPEIENVTFLWSDGTTDDFLAISNQGEYWLEVDDNGCIARDTIQVDYLSDSAVSLGNDTILCTGENLLLDVEIPGALITWRDGSNNDSFLIDIPGNYWVTVEKDGCTQRDTVEVDFTTIETGFDSTAFICQGEALLLDASSIPGTFIWQDGSTNSSLSVVGPGVYWVDATVGGCSNRDSVIVDFQSGPDSIFAFDAYICEDQGIWFDASFDGATYLWQDGSTEPMFKAVAPGDYSVQININNCVFEESVTLISCERCLYVPNIFSPNGDGINDELFTFQQCALEDYHLSIFDRWGNMVFESFSPQLRWDGFHKGEKAAIDTYVYSLKYTLLNAGQPLSQNKTGSITIIR